MTHKNLFLVAHAFSHLKADVLNRLSEADLQAAQKAIQLDQELESLGEAYMVATLNDDRTLKSRLEVKRARVAISLSVQHIIPTMILLDENLNHVCKRLTGETLTALLPSLKFRTGDHGGWFAVSSRHQNLELVLSDSTPGYPRLIDCELSLTPEDEPESPGYVLTVQDGMVQMDATQALHELLRPPLIPSKPSRH